MSVNVQPINVPLKGGEGPHWDERQQALFFVSIFPNTINKYVPATALHTKTILDKHASFIIPVEGELDQFILGLERKLVVVRWDGKEGSLVADIRELGEVDQDKPNNKFNDGKADPKGRLYSGTLCFGEGIGFDMFTKNVGSLYRYDGRVMKLDEGITLANGMAWDLKEKAYYYVDSLEYNIRRYDYDVITGVISNRKYIFDFKVYNIEGIPDGMTIDTEGNLWVAVFCGSCVLNIDPRTGKLLRKVDIPAKQVTSVTFGGPDLDVLFVTTGSIEFEGVKPPGGSIYIVSGLGVKGHDNIRVKLNF